MKRQVCSPAPDFRIEIGSGFLLLCALIIFFSGPGFLPALLIAAFFHELGHLLAMLFFGAFPTRLRLGASGFRIDYSGGISPLQEMLTALAGPALGLIFSFFCALTGSLLERDFLLLCAGLGFLLNAFNLLPILPLDGGRLMGFTLVSVLGNRRGGSLSFGLSRLFALALCLLGLLLLIRGLGPALFISGSLLLVLQLGACQSSRRSIE